MNDEKKEKIIEIPSKKIEKFPDKNSLKVFQAKNQSTLKNKEILEMNIDASINLSENKKYLMPPSPKCSSCAFRTRCQYAKEGQSCYFYKEAAKRVMKFGNDPIYLVVRMLQRQEALLDLMIENGAEDRVIQVQQNNALKSMELLLKFTEDKKKEGETEETNWAKKAEMVAKELKKISPRLAERGLKKSDDK